MKSGIVCLLMESTELIPCFSLLVHIAFSLPYALISAHKFSRFYISSSLSQLTWGVRVIGRVVLSCQG